MIMYNKKIFSERIKEIRNARNETQKEFAKFVNSTAATISAYENGTKNPSLEVVANIANKCNVSIDWLCGLSEKKKSGKIETCSDILSFLYELSLHDYWLSPYNIELVTNDDINLSISEIVFHVPLITSAVREFEKIYKLYSEKTIDEDMYNILISSLFTRYSMPLSIENEAKP